MKFVRKSLVFLVIALISIILPVQAVMAAITPLSCDAAGVGTGGLFDPAVVSDTPPTVDSPCGDVSGDRIFSSIACNYVLVLNDVFSKFFCALQFGMQEFIVAVVALFIVIYGAKLLMGTQEATAGATILAFIKIGVVYMFVTKGTLAVSMIYNFFISFIEQTVSWVISAINCPTVICLTNRSIASIFSDIDDKIKTMISGVDDGTGTGTNINGLFTQNAELITFIIVLCLIAFPLFLLAISLIKMTIMLFVRSLVTFMLAITAVAFLISLSPIFMSFMLFNSTYSLFDNWLRFLVSYSLQPMIIFAVFALWLLICTDLVSFVGQLTKVIVVLPESRDKAAILTIKDTLAFCPLHYGNSASSVMVNTGVNPPITLVPGGPTIQCCRWVTAPPLIDPVCVQPNVPITPEKYLLQPSDPLYDPLYSKVSLIPPEAMLRDSQFIYFLGYHFVALLAIGYAFLHLIEMTPQIAQSLAKSQAAMPLGAGFGNGGSLGSMISQATSGGRNLVSRGMKRPVEQVADAVSNARNRAAAQASGGGPKS